MLTLETAKKLKEAGWDKETVHGYCNYYLSNEDDIPYSNKYANDFFIIETSEYESIIELDLAEKDTEFYPCPSLEELLAVMRIDLHEVRAGIAYIVTTYLAKEIENPTEAVAQLWLKLKEGKLI